jgi:hypothetical protein
MVIRLAIISVTFGSKVTKTPGEASSQDLLVAVISAGLRQLVEQSSPQTAFGYFALISATPRVELAIPRTPSGNVMKTLNCFQL